MTLDRTLKSRGGLASNRSVLTRAERIEILTNEGKFDPEKDSPFGLVKTRVRHSKAGTKSKKVEEVAAEEIAEGTEEASSDS